LHPLPFSCNLIETISRSVKDSTNIAALSIARDNRIITIRQNDGPVCAEFDDCDRFCIAAREFGWGVVLCINPEPDGLVAPSSARLY
jgi:hypothetical protein